MLFVHLRAKVIDYKKLPPPLECPKNKNEHFNQEETCLYLSYYSCPSEGFKNMRKTGDITYPVWDLGGDWESVEKEPALFMWLPISTIDLIQKEDGTYNEKILKKSIESEWDIPLRLMEE